MKPLPGPRQKQLVRAILLILLFLPWAVSCTTPWEIGPRATITPTALPLTPTASRTPTLAPSSTPAAAPTQSPRAGQYPYTREVRIRTGNEEGRLAKIRFLLYLPEAYFSEEHKPWPLILYLHGSGEAGTELSLLKRNGLPKILANDPNFPFIVVSPQIPAPPPMGGSSTQFDAEAYLATWGWKPYIPCLEALLEDLSSSLQVDENRVSLTGISLGGFGAWQYALEHPARFAAVVPLAGGYRFVDNQLPPNLCDLKDLPIWAFHGGQDQNVLAARSQALVDGLKACGGSPRFTLYPELGHDVWTAAYADPGLWDWLLIQAMY